jgi:sugar phosphate isomerase/epimerase
VIKRSIDLAVSLCSTLVVIHPGRVVGDHSMDRILRDMYHAGRRDSLEYHNLSKQLMVDRKERGLPHLESLLKSMGELVAFSSNSGLSLGLENRLYYYEMPIFGELETLLNAFQDAHVGWQYDVGHLQIHHTLGLTTREDWLERFKDRIVGVHLHDVKGIEDHLSPGKGEVDFAKIGLILPTYCTRTLEVSSKTNAQEIRSGMETLVTAGCVSRI